MGDMGLSSMGVASGTKGGGSSSSSDLVVALETEEVSVEELRVVLNKLDSSDSLA